MDTTSLGDRMKSYEALSETFLMRRLPVIVRLDGVNFSAFTKGLSKPYDQRIIDLMTELTKALVSKTNAKIGYTQSDEISLVIYMDDIKSDPLFNNRIQKIVSKLAAFASVKFNKLLPEFLPEKAELEPIFDARVFVVPNKTEAANAILWREQDATRNSIQSAGHAVFSHKQMHLKNAKEIQAMLLDKGINWNDYPAQFKRGTFVRRVKNFRSFSAEELERLPPKHKAHNNPDMVIERTSVEVIEVPPFSKVLNREGFIFNQELPISES